MDVKDAKAVSLSIPMNRTKSAPSPIFGLIHKRQINKMIHGLCVLGVFSSVHVTFVRYPYTFVMLMRQS